MPDVNQSFYFSETSCALMGGNAFVLWAFPFGHRPAGDGFSKDE
jgi:hypothetical protein